jgi:tRNA-binding EMAP/Myf-like protein
LTVDFGDEIRTVVTNIKPYLVHVDYLVNLKFLFITNLKVVKMMGIESSAMIMPGQVEEGKVITCSGELGSKLL